MTEVPENFGEVVTETLAKAFSENFVTEVPENDAGEMLGHLVVVQDMLATEMLGNLAENMGNYFLASGAFVILAKILESVSDERQTGDSF